MDHQDWNNIKFNDKNNKSDAKKAHSNQTQNSEYEASKDLTKMIGQARTTKGKNQKQLATELDISPQILGRWESGKEIPTNAQIAAIEKNLGIQLPRNKKVEPKEI
jgi:ribosome-binding protein aMBF1 (putative translation factor)